ncbi:hypothetical protein IWX91DRAFT_8401 [Phyllosticta citricarpa]
MIWVLDFFSFFFFPLKRCASLRHSWAVGQAPTPRATGDQCHIISRHSRSPLIKTEDSIVMDMLPPSLEQLHLIKPHKRHNTPTDSGYGGSIPHTAIHSDGAIKRGSSPALSDH